MPSLIIKQSDGSERTLEVGAKPLIIGRLAESEIQIRDPFISRVHAGIGYANNHFTLKDFGSANGTYRNGARVFECALTPGDRIQVGNTAMIFELDSANSRGFLRPAPAAVPASRPFVAAPPPVQPGGLQAGDYKVTMAVPAPPPNGTGR